TPSASASHWSACCAQSATSVRLTNPSSRRRRAASSSSSSSTSPTVTRTRGTPVYGADVARLTGALRGAPTATSAAGGDAGLELSPEGGVFSNDFLIPLALDRRLRYRSDLAYRFGVFQVRID